MLKASFATVGKVETKKVNEKYFIYNLYFLYNFDSINISADSENMFLCSTFFFIRIHELLDMNNNY